MRNFYFKQSSVISTVLRLRLLFFLIFVSLFFSQSLYSQCKLEKSKDDFSSSQIINSNDVTLASVFPLIGSKDPWDLVMSFWLVDNNITISVTHKSQSYSEALSSISFKFRDSTIISKGATNTYDYNTGLGYSYTTTDFDLTEEDLMIFASKDLLKFRAVFKYYPDYPIVEEDIKKKSNDKIRNDASCLLSEFKLAADAPKNLTENCKYIKNIVDDFTKDRIVQTNAAQISSEYANGKIVFTNVCGSNINGTNGLLFTWGCNFMALQSFDQVDLLLINGEVISFKEDVASELSTVNSVNFSYKLFTISNDSIWEKLKITPLKKLKLSKGTTDFGTVEINKKYITSIMKVINCVDILGIPKSNTTVDPNKSE